MPKNGTNQVARGTGWWWLWGALSLGIILSAAGPLLVGQGLRLDPAKTGALAPNLLWTGGVVWLSGITLGIFNQVVNKKRERKRARDLTGFNDDLSDVHKAVADLVRSERDSIARKAFFSAVVNKASALFSLEGVRVCVYELEDVDVDVERSDNYLKLIDHGGRSDEPRVEFRTDTVHGRAAVTLAQGTSHICVPDPKRSTHAVERSPQAVWQSFFAVPLRDNHTPRGLLTVDTRKRSAFTEEDVAIARTVGAFIVLGMSELVGAAIDTRPEVKQAIDQLQNESDDAPAAKTSALSTTVGD